MIIAFSFLSLLDKDYKSEIIKFNELDSSNWLHYDVMDGKFVSNSTFDYRLIKEISDYNKIFNDVHLMINTPSQDIKEYAKCNIDQLTFHYEAEKKDKILDLINEIKSNKMKVGISIKPDTNVEEIEEYLGYLDYILIMSVEPGKGGQKFIESSLEKIKYLKTKQNNYHYLIGVDGGINDETAKMVKKSGADVIVVGTYLASNLNKKTLELLK